MGAAPLLTDDELIERERACGVRYGPFWRARYLDRAPERVRRELELAARFPRLRADMREHQGEVGLGGQLPLVSQAAVTAGTETAIYNAALYALIPANDEAPSSVYRASFGGIYSNRTTSSPASTWQLRFGTTVAGTALGGSGAVYSGAALTNAPMYGEATVGIRRFGDATNQTQVFGTAFVVRGNASARIVQPFGTASASSTNTTADSGICVTHVWSATNAANTLTVQWVWLDRID